VIACHPMRGGHQVEVKVVTDMRQRPKYHGKSSAYGGPRDDLGLKGNLDKIIEINVRLDGGHKFGSCAGKGQHTRGAQGQEMR
jgi:hypothetical protein